MTYLFVSTCRTRLWAPGEDFWARRGNFVFEGRVAPARGKLPGDLANRMRTVARNACPQGRDTRGGSRRGYIPLSLYFLPTTRNSNEPGSTVGQGFGGTGGPSLPDGR
jgi:hypothetical protein